jgi:hypothetical protein
MKAKSKSMKKRIAAQKGEKLDKYEKKEPKLDKKKVKKTAGTLRSKVTTEGGLY